MQFGASRKSHQQQPVAKIFIYKLYACIDTCASNWIFNFSRLTQNELRFFYRTPKCTTNNTSNRKRTQSEQQQKNERIRLFLLLVCRIDSYSLTLAYVSFDRLIRAHKPLFSVYSWAVCFWIIETQFVFIDTCVCLCYSFAT